MGLFLLLFQTSLVFLLLWVSLLIDWKQETVKISSDKNKVISTLSIVPKNKKHYLNN